MSGSGHASSNPQFDRFFEEVYQELLRMARLKGLSALTPTLNSTALVSEAYLKMRSAAGQQWNEAEHVKAVASLVMVQILRTHLRGKSARKRGNGISVASIQRDPLAESIASGSNMELEILQRLDLLEALKEEDPRKIRVAAMRLCGYEITEIAATMGVGTATIKRDLAHLRAILRVYLSVRFTDEGDP